MGHLSKRDGRGPAPPDAGLLPVSHADTPAPLEEALDARYKLWVDGLYDRGYELRPATWDPGPAGIGVLAIRPAIFGDPKVTVTVFERWRIGGDPDGLPLEWKDCHLERASWNARFEGPQGVGSERLDVDRRKSPSEMMHRHRAGRRDSIRKPVPSMPPPGAWLVHVDNLLLKWHGF